MSGWDTGAAAAPAAAGWGEPAAAAGWGAPAEPAAAPEEEAADFSWDPQAFAAPSGGGGGGGGSGSGNRGCHNCGKEGHMSRECPEPRKPRACHKCNNEGHMARDCPNPSAQSTTCRRCNEEGHMSRDCPKPREDKCFNCGEIGHRKEDCTQPSTATCFNCGETGHRRGDCPQPQKEDTCFHCGETGHIKPNCPNAPKRVCYRCKEEGHSITECPQPAPPDEKPRAPLYTPVYQEITEATFSDRIAAGKNFANLCDSGVHISDESIKPVQTFDEMNFHPVLRANIEKMGFKVPTKIQKYAIPVISSGRDVLGFAQTGSGKTFAFLAPIINSLLQGEIENFAGRSPQTPYVLIIATTRELAVQLFEEARLLCNGTDLHAGVLYGQTNMSVQTANLKKRGCHILVGTCGRLKHFLEDRRYSLEKLRYFVLDEADSLLADNFELDIRAMVEHRSITPKEERQMLMFSATFSPAAENLANDYLKENVVRLDCDVTGTVNKDVIQNFILIEDPKQKRTILQNILELHPSTKKLAEKPLDGPRDSIIVFAETKKEADYLATYFAMRKFNCVSIHSDRTQEQREKALRDFKDGTYCILVCTAVCAHGLDIKGVTKVINYDLPKEIDLYVHKVGRTGRVGNTGTAVSFFCPSTDAALAPHLVRVLTESNQEVPDYISAAAGGTFKSAAAGGDAAGGATGEFDW